ASNTAALSFGDKKAALETLNSLHGDQRLLRAVVYDKAGDPFISYALADGNKTVAPERLRPDGAYFEHDSLLLFRPVTFSGERIGTVLLVSSMSESRSRFKRYVGIVVIVLPASLLLSLLVMGRLQRIITGPIAYLSGVAQRVSTERNYTLRAHKRANDEIGSLVDSFNDM